MRRIMALALLLGSAAAQQMAVGLASPNTRDSMSYAEAQASLTSFEEANFVAVADRIVCSLAKRGRVEAAIGEAHEKGKLGLEGAENSAVVEAPLLFDEMRYAMALLGRYAHQKFVIAFAPAQEGTAEVLLLRMPANTPVTTVEKTLDGEGVLYRTLLPGNRVLVFLAAGESDAAVRKAAQRLGATLERRRGQGEIVGDDDRGRAMADYDRIIAAFERSHPSHALSQLLWSRAWHDAEGMSCTK